MKVGALVSYNPSYTPASNPKPELRDPIILSQLENFKLVGLICLPFSYKVCFFFFFGGGGGY